MRIGLIQTRGIGDIVIAAPIAQHYIDQGHTVSWPVDARFLPFVQAAFPEIDFMPVDTRETGDGTRAYFYDTPAALLQARGCGQIFCLYSYLSGLDVVNGKLARSLKFDEYKYAVASVPFDRKWQLRVTRDRVREQALFDRLDIQGPYALLHEFGSNFKLQIDLPPDIVATHQVVRISELSSNPFDWLGVIEHASLFACVDSCFANLAEQLDLCTWKFLFLRSDIGFTPVFRGNWQFR